MNIPQRLFIEITSECNLKCNLCKLWKQKDSINSLKLKEKINFLNLIINWLENHDIRFKEKFSVILTGGEPFLYPNQVFKIAKLCQLNEIKCYVNTNGVLIQPFIERIINSGLSAITISLDTHISNIHDNLRRYQGLFNKNVGMIKKLLKHKQDRASQIQICIQSILGRWNINSLKEHVYFFQKLGIDGLIFQPIQFPFGEPIPSNWHKTFDKFPNLESEINNAIKYLLEEKQKNGFIMNSRREIELWRSYFKNPEYLDNDINPCKSFEQNLIIDIDGNVKFCFNHALNPLDFVGNIRNTSIEVLLNGENAFLIRKKMHSCKRACGIMACHVDTNLRSK